MAQVDSTGIIDKKSEEARDKAMHSLEVIYEEITSLPDLPEVDWTRIRTFEFQDLLRQRTSLMERIDKFHCPSCPDFDDHVCSRDIMGSRIQLTSRQYAALHEIKTVEASLQELKRVLSDQNLELLPDYESRVDVLKKLKFIDERSTVLLKGRVACEVSAPVT